MKKFTKLILGAVFSVGCLFAFAGCNNSDYAAEIQSLKDRIGELEEMIDPPSGDSSGSSFTGSPKFNYDSIGEPISYYIQGTKIFDFTITDFRSQDATVVEYTVSFTPEYNEEIKTAFSISLYGLESNTLLYPTNYFGNDGASFNWTTGETSKITLRYHGNPFACITAKPRRVSNYG